MQTTPAIGTTKKQEHSFSGGPIQRSPAAPRPDNGRHPAESAAPALQGSAHDLLERDLDFLRHVGDGALGARQSERGHTIEGCAAKEHEFRPQCERDHDVRSAAEAAIHQNREFAANRGLYLRKHFQRRRRRIKLSGSMVGHEDAVDTQLGGPNGIVGGEDSLENKGAGRMRRIHTG